jgi:hypothetical protein
MDNGCVPGRADATEQLAGEIENLLSRVDAFPALDARPEGEILGYGQDAAEPRHHAKIIPLLP